MHDSVEAPFNESAARELPEFKARIKCNNIEKGDEDDDEIEQ